MSASAVMRQITAHLAHKSLQKFLQESERTKPFMQISCLTAKFTLRCFVTFRIRSFTFLVGFLNFATVCNKNIILGLDGKDCIKNILNKMFLKISNCYNNKNMTSNTFKKTTVRRTRAKYNH
jgi:hypothetical protein